MDPHPDEFVTYKRGRFRSRLPASYRYTASHYWMRRNESGIWEVGFTNFATRILGEFVELGFETGRDDPVRVGQIIGWIEGFKAVTDVYCVVEGRFSGHNERVYGNPGLACSDPFHEGWLYSVEGTPDPESFGVEEYTHFLNRTIDRMLEQPWRTPET